MFLLQGKNLSYAQEPLAPRSGFVGACGRLGKGGAVFGEAGWEWGWCIVRSKWAEIWFLAASPGAPPPAVRWSHRWSVSAMILFFFSFLVSLWSWGTIATIPALVWCVSDHSHSTLTLLQVPWECSLLVPLETQHFVTTCWWDVPREMVYQVKTGGK